MYPFDKSQEIIDQFNTSDPFEICGNLGIHILYCDLPINIQGFFQNINGEMIIYINSNIEENRVDFVLGHELGHVILHNELNTIFLKENTYFNIDKLEREADIFSAYLNIDKYEGDITPERASALLDVDLDVAMKILEYKKLHS